VADTSSNSSSSSSGGIFLAELPSAAADHALLLQQQQCSGADCGTVHMFSTAVQDPSELCTNVHHQQQQVWNNLEQLCVLRATHRLQAVVSSQWASLATYEGRATALLTAVPTALRKRKQSLFAAAVVCTCRQQVWLDLGDAQQPC
jgi:hypothetical protein